MQSLGGLPLWNPQMSDHASLSPGTLYVSFPSRCRNFFIPAVWGPLLPKGPGFCVSIVHAHPPLASAASRSCLGGCPLTSATCSAPGLPSLSLSKSLMCHSHLLSLLHSPGHVTIHDDDGTTTCTRAIWPFLFPRTHLPFRHSHSQTSVSPATALPLVSPPM